MENAKLWLRLCGQFPLAKADGLNKWTDRLTSASDGDLKQYYNFYYADVVDFTFGRCQTYSLLDKPFAGTLECLGQKANIEVAAVKSRVMPYGIVVFWAEISCEAEDLNVFTALGYTLRDCGVLDRKYCDDELIDRIFAPVRQFYADVTGQEAFGISNLMSQGNKFKLFQVVEVPIGMNQTTQEDVLLYQLATMGRIGDVDENSQTGMSLEYLQNEVQRNMLHVFNDWRAIALFDTFTILRKGIEPNYRTNMWLDDYFGIIYLYNIFHKFYLQQFNRNFRKPGTDVKEMADQLDDFRYNCKFNKISYNFLPNDINKIIYAALDIEDERTNLHQIIHQESARQEEANANRLNNVLTFLTILTIFSTLTDSVSLCWQLFEAETPTDAMFYSRLLASILVLTVLLVAIVTLRKPKR